MALLISAMKEDFLYYLWEGRILVGDLMTEEGLPVQIIDPGYRNTNSGPDFLEAKIRIGHQLWAGHVEIHVRTSDWLRHGHQNDKAFHNVVLHVVYEHDSLVNDIPVLALKGHFNSSLYEQYHDLVSTQRWIACERRLDEVPSLTRCTWLERMAIERLQEKTKMVDKLLKTNHFDWEDTLYRLMLRYFGMKVNNEAFETLSSLLPFKTLLKHADQQVQLEAMLLGCAGFLEIESEEEYPLLLKREFEAMKAKFNLLTMPVERWKFMRMRPMNFPTVRLAQLAQMIHLHGPLFSKVKEAATLEELKSLFDVKASKYWDTHFRFSFEGPSLPKHLGEGITNVLVINAIVPLLFCYGKFHKDERHCEKALRLLGQTPAEDNTIVRHYAHRGLPPHDAMQSQALLQLYHVYCRRKRCMECGIGIILLRSNKD